MLRYTAAAELPLGFPRLNCWKKRTLNNITTNRMVLVGITDSKELTPVRIEESHITMDGMFMVCINAFFHSLVESKIKKTVSIIT